MILNLSGCLFRHLKSIKLREKNQRNGKGLFRKRNSKKKKKIQLLKRWRIFQNKPRRFTIHSILIKMTFTVSFI